MVRIVSPRAREKRKMVVYFLTIVFSTPESGKYLVPDSGGAENTLAYRINSGLGDFCSVCFNQEILFFLMVRKDAVKLHKIETTVLALPYM